MLKPKLGLIACLCWILDHALNLYVEFRYDSSNLTHYLVWRLLDMIHWILLTTLYGAYLSTLKAYYSLCWMHVWLLDLLFWFVGELFYRFLFTDPHELVSWDDDIGIGACYILDHVYDVEKGCCDAHELLWVIWMCLEPWTNEIVLLLIR